MALQKVKITLENGALGGSAGTADNVCGLLLNGNGLTASGAIKLDAPVAIFSLNDAVNLGITETSTNSFAHYHIKEFYDLADNGTELWIMITENGTSMTDMMDISKGHINTLIEGAKGRIRKLAVSSSNGDDQSVEGLDIDVHNALIKGQQAADKYTDEFKPFRFLVDGKYFTGQGSDLRDYSTSDYNRGGIFISHTNSNNSFLDNSSVGLALGAMAALPVMRKISRVKNGSLPITDANFSASANVEKYEDQWQIIHDKGYIFIQSYVGKSGYFMTSDKTCTSAADDYSSFSRGYVIDKAFMLAYQHLVNEIDDEIRLAEDGAIDVAEAKTIQNDLENVIRSQMINIGLPEANEVKVLVNPNQNVLAAGRIEISLKVQPLAYKSFIEVPLGFTTTTV